MLDLICETTPFCVSREYAATSEVGGMSREVDAEGQPVFAAPAAARALGVRVQFVAQRQPWWHTSRESKLDPCLKRLRGVPDVSRAAHLLLAGRARVEDWPNSAEGSSSGGLQRRSAR